MPPAGKVLEKKLADCESIELKLTWPPPKVVSVTAGMSANGALKWMVKTSSEFTPDTVKVKPDPDTIEVSAATTPRTI